MKSISISSLPSASALDGSELLLADQAGDTRVISASLLINSINASASDIPIATSAYAGRVKPDGTSIIVDETGKISVAVSAIPISVAASAIPILNQSTTGSAGTITGSIAESQVTNLTNDLNAKVPKTTKINNHALSGDVTITKIDVQLGNVPNVDTTNASNITSGTLSASVLPTATTDALGAVKVDGTTITINNGVISSVAGTGGEFTGDASSLVPKTTTINSKPLTGNITLTPSDIATSFPPAAHGMSAHSDWPIAVSMTEVGYLDGVTAPIQNQINSLAGTSVKNVLSLGVLNNGSDQGALINSILASASAGDVFYFPKGTYGTSVQLVLPATFAISIIADGPSTTTFRALAGMQSVFFKAANPTVSFSPIFKGFTIDCNLLAGVGMQLQTYKQAKIRDIWVQNWVGDSALQLGMSTGSGGVNMFYEAQIENLELLLNPSLYVGGASSLPLYGIHFLGTASDNFLSRIVIAYPQTAGIYDQGGANSYSQIHPWGTPSYPMQYGIKTTWGRSSITSSEFDTQSVAGVYISGTSAYVSVTGNVFSNGTPVGTKLDNGVVGISIAGNSYDASVTSKYTGTPGAGFSFLEGVTYGASGGNVPQLDGAGTLPASTIPVASNTAIGGVKVDNSSITINNGIITSTGSGLVPKTTTINSKPLSGNVTLVPSDIATVFPPASHSVSGHSDWPSTVDMTEVGYLNGVTGNIQTQFNLLSTVVNVKNAPYNAVGNGIADDTTAIQNAINSFGTSGGVVFLPPGTFKITSTITIPQNVVIKGSGYSLDDSYLVKATTALSVGATINGPVLSIGDGSKLWYGNGIEDVAILLNDTARIGIQFNAAAGGFYKNVFVLGDMSGAAPTYAQTAYLLTTTSSGANINTMFNTFINVKASMVNTIIKMGYTALSNVCHNSFMNTGGSYYGDGFYLEGDDNNNFSMTYLFARPGATGYGVKLLHGTANDSRYFYQLQAQTGVFVGSNSSAVIFGYDKTNGQPNPVLQDSSAKLTWTTDSANSDGWHLSGNLNLLPSSKITDGTITKSLADLIAPTSSSYKPATYIIAPYGSTYVADYYATQTDASLAFQTAFDNIKASGKGGKILCMEGTYLFTNTVSALEADSVIVEGFSNTGMWANGGTIFQRNADVVMFNFAPNPNKCPRACGFKNIQFKNNTSGYANPVLRYENCHNMSQENCYFNNVQQAILAYGAWDFWTLNCNFRSCGTGDTLATACIGVANGISSMGGRTIGNNGSGWKIIGCRFETRPGTSIYLEPSTTYAMNNFSLTDTKFEGVVPAYVTYSGHTYKCILSHTSSAGLTPDVDTTRWTLFDVVTAGTFLNWSGSSVYYLGSLGEAYPALSGQGYQVRLTACGFYAGDVGWNIIKLSAASVTVIGCSFSGHNEPAISLTGDNSACNIIEANTFMYWQGSNLGENIKGKSHIIINSGSGNVIKNNTKLVSDTIPLLVDNGTSTTTDSTLDDGTF